MHFAVILEHSKKVLTIPIKWFKSINLKDLMDHGLDCNQSFIIFYSPDRDAYPDFNLKSSTEFSANNSACYSANILKMFEMDEEEKCKKYCLTKRSILPVIYNQNGKHCFSSVNTVVGGGENRENNEQISDAKKAVLNEINDKIQAMNNMEIDVYDVEEFQDIICSDGEEQISFDASQDALDDGNNSLPENMSTNHTTAEEQMNNIQANNIHENVEVARTSNIGDHGQQHQQRTPYSYIDDYEEYIPPKELIDWNNIFEHLPNRNYTYELKVSII